MSPFEEPTPHGVRELDAGEIEGVAGASAYLKAMIRNGPGHYIANAPVTMRALGVGDLVVPLVIAEPAREAADVCSPHSHYVGYTLVELGKRSTARALRGYRLGLEALGAVLRACRIDRVVYVDNWLLATNPVTPLSADQPARITALLRDRYPRHAIVHRSVNPGLDAARPQRLREAGYRLVKCRRVFVFDPCSDQVRRRNDVKNDRRLLARTRFEIAWAGAADASEAAALARHYHALYGARHCRLNPHYRERFFALVLRDPIFSTFLLRRNGAVAGFGSMLVNAGHMTGVVLGYGHAVPRREGLYRQLVMIKLAAAERADMRLNLSGGAEEFKRQRGGVEHVEYDAVYDRHLSAWRRLAWRLVELEGALWRTA